MPGATAPDSLASVAATSGEQGSGLAAAVIQLVQALQARPRTYEVRVFSERCEAGGQINRDGGRRRSHRRGARSADRAECGGPGPPAMRPGRDGGEGRGIHRPADLPSMIRPRPRGRRAHSTARTCVPTCWPARRARPGQPTGPGASLPAGAAASGCSESVGPDRAPGWSAYEHAGLYDLDGENVRALLLHLGNRIHYPQFWRGRFRLAVSLSMLAGRWTARAPHRLDRGAEQQLAGRWTALMPACPTRACSGICSACAKAVRSNGPSGQRAESRPAGARPAPGGPPRTDRVLAAPSCQRPAVDRVLERRIRSPSLAAVPSLPKWWRHLRRRLWSLEFARAIVRQRMFIAGRSAATADKPAPRPAPGQAAARPPGAAGGRGRGSARAWCYGRAAWHAVYNAACLHALPDSRATRQILRPRGRGRQLEAVELLRLAISDPDCDLDRPSERLATDPGLRSLRGLPEFGDLVREQAESDFGVSGAERHRSEAQPW